MTIIGNVESDELRRRFQGLSKSGKKLEKAISTVLAGGVKEIVFLPTGRRFLIVVGTLGDEFIDPKRSYCSCSHFFFRVLGGNDQTCYHLLSYKMASELGLVDVVTFDDSEYGLLFATIVGDVFTVIDRSSGRPSIALD